MSEAGCQASYEGPALILNEEANNTVRYSYRVTWSVRARHVFCGCFLTDIVLGI